MKKILILAVAVSLVIAGVAMATVVSTKHDMRAETAAGVKASGSATEQVCVFCHHPHRGSNTSVTTVLLWNVSGPASTYPTYAGSASMSATGGSPITDTGAGAYSFLCMACHDETAGNNAFIKAAVDGTLGTPPDLSGTIFDLGSTLADDHPVNFTYADAVTATSDVLAATGDEVSGTSSGTSYPLYSGTMQCATCHDVHNGQSSLVQFMRGSGDIITGSAICIDCHTSK